MVENQQVSLFNNQITAINSGVFTGLTALQTLILHSNLFTTINIGVFTGLTVLQALDLTYNQHIPAINSGVFTGLTALQTLYLQYNPTSQFEVGAFAGLQFPMPGLTGLLSDMFMRFTAPTSIITALSDRLTTYITRRQQ